MNNRNSFDHLGKIYFDNKKKKPVNRKLTFFLILTVIAVTALSLTVIFGYKVKLLKPKSYSLYLSSRNLIKIEYDFKDNPAAKLANYTIELQGLNLNGFKALLFNARHLKSKEVVNLKIEIESSFKENALIYIGTITNRWSLMNIKLEDFKGISSWDSIKRISFVAEEWNTSGEGKRNTVYIEDVRLVK